MSEVEAKFSLEELFYSKTDFKGLIQSWNEVFARIAEFSSEELHNRPHNIVRHPDMPRAVFRLFWNVLKAGQPIGAYVKNKSKSGKFYWVYALAFPMSDGYLSVRLKPSSQYFQIVQNLYKEMIEAESQGQGMDEVTGLLVKRLAEAGFASYESFMKAALIAELESREKILGESDRGNEISLPPEREQIGSATSTCDSEATSAIHVAREILEKTSKLVNETVMVEKACDEVGFITVNLAVASSKLGEAGRPLAAVSSNLEKLTGEIRISSSTFAEFYERLLHSAQDMYFLVAVSKFQIEIMARLVGETCEPSALITNCNLLKKLVSTNFEKVAETSRVLSKANLTLINSISGLIRVTGGLEVIRIVGKIETVRLESLSLDISSRLTEMEKLTEVFKTALRGLEKECSKLTEDCLNLQDNLDKISLQLKKIEQCVI